MEFIGVLLTLVAGITALGTVATLCTNHGSSQYWAYCLSSVCLAFVGWLVWFGLFVAGLQVPISEGNQSAPNSNSAAQESTPDQSLDSVAYVAGATKAGQKSGEPQSTENSRDSGNNSAGQQKSSKGEWWLRCFEVVGSLALGIFIAYFAYVSSGIAESSRDVADKQWKAMREQNAIMQEQMGQTDKQIEIAQGQAAMAQNQQRPWFSFAGPSPAGPLEEGKFINYEIGVRNSGGSPGWVIAAAHDFVVVDVQFKGDKSVHVAPTIFLTSDSAGRRESLPMGGMTIAPGFSIGLPQVDAELKVGDFARLHEGKLKIYFVGLVIYVDASGTPHWTSSVAEYHPRSKKFIGGEMFNLMDRTIGDSPPDVVDRYFKDRPWQTYMKIRQISEQLAANGDSWIKEMEAMKLRNEALAKGPQPIDYTGATVPPISIPDPTIQDFEANKPVEWQALVRNNSDSTVTIESFDSTVYFHSAEMNPDITLAIQGEGGLPIGGDGKSLPPKEEYGRYYVTPYNLQPETHTRILDGSATTYFIGRVTWIDAQGKSHWTTRFCRYSPTTKQFSEVGIFNQTDGGNGSPIPQRILEHFSPKPWRAQQTKADNAAQPADPPGQGATPP